MCGFWGAAHPTCLTREPGELLARGRTPESLYLSVIALPLRAGGLQEMVSLGLQRGSTVLEPSGTWLGRGCSLSQRRCRWSGVCVFWEAPQRDGAHSRSHEPSPTPPRALAHPERPNLQLSPPLLPATWSRLISLRPILSFEVGPSLPRGVNGSNVTCLGQEVKLQTLASSGHTGLPCPWW